ncbi:MAG: glycosyltransferase [Phycisphaerales bacterium]|nr:glycosyltransferase [Phycisphaerales bacterium]
MPKSPTISIAMCLYEPDPNFLSEQLQSFLDQSVLPDELVVCDDSNESHSEYFTEWARGTNIDVKYVHNDAPLGINANFSKAVALTSGDYVLLSDQDDVWEPLKIEVSVDTIQLHESDEKIPTLFHTDLLLIDEQTRLVGSTFMKKQRIHGGVERPLGLLMFHNIVTGCSAAMNRPLIEIAFPVPQQAVVHDWWLALVAASNGQIIFDHTPLVQYRLHDANAIGLRPLISFRNIVRLFRFSHIGIEYAKVVHQTLAFRDRFGDTIDDNLRDFFKSLHRGGLPLVVTAYKAGIKPQAFSRLVRFWVSAISKTYKKHI